MADSQQQQVTSKTPATKQKNPKRVAADKAIAERTKMAREAQKKVLIEAQSIIAKKQADPAPVSNTLSADPPPVDEPTKDVLTTTQWLSVISIVVSLAGLYYKREEIKGLFTKKTASSTARSSKLTCRFCAKKRHQTDGVKINLIFSYYFHNNGCSSDFH